MGNKSIIGRRGVKEAADGLRWECSGDGDKAAHSVEARHQTADSTRCFELMSPMTASPGHAGEPGGSS